MNTTTETFADSNKSGSLKRKAHAPLTEALKWLTEAEVERMVNHPEYASRIEEVMSRCSVEPLKLFSEAVTTTLSDGSKITVLTPSKAGTFVEWFSAALNVPADTSSAQSIAKLLIDRGHLVSEPQIKEMKKRTDRGEPTGMRTDGWGNWFPRKNGNSVSVGSVTRDRLRWYGHDCDLASSRRWDAENRILLCNLDPSKLGL